MGKLKVRVNGQWEEVTPAVEEVVVAPDDPYVTDPTTAAELWFDPDGVSTFTDEVYVGPDDPDVITPGSNRELWYDTDEPAPNMGGMDEVWVGPDDPLALTPGTELWYSPSSGAPVPPPPVWDIATTYAINDVVLWPASPDHWQAARSTTGEEPGVPPAAVTGGVQFPGGSGSLPEGLNTDTRQFDLSGGVDVRVLTNGTISEGIFCAFNAAMGAELGLSFGRSGSDLRVDVRTASGVTSPVSVPIGNFTPATHPWLRIIATSARVTFYQSTDGTLWQQVADRTQASSMSGGLVLKIGHRHEDPLMSYTGVLAGVETRDLIGALWTQWIPANQPNPDGTGISPTTAEDYYAFAGNAPLTPVNVTPPSAWASIPAPPVVPYVPGALKANVGGVWEDVPPTGAAMKAQVRAHHIYGAITTSPWTWTLAAGTYLSQFQCSCVASANGLRYANLNMDGVQVAQSKMYFNVTGQHHFMNTGVSVLTIPADGDYFFDITMSASATMDTNDFGHFTIIPCEPGAVH